MQSKRGRLDRFVSQHTGISRNALRRVFATGRVQVDGVVETDPARQIDEFSHIVLDSGAADERVLQANTPLYVMLNKPAGVISATRDKKHKTVLDLIDHPRKHELHIVGRLDLNSSGLLLLTNDSRWSKNIMSPEAKVEKIYRVEVEKELTEEYIDAFAGGMYFAFEDITTQPAVLEITGEKSARVILKEGKYHQIKRMFGRFRNAVVSLHRERVGELGLLNENGEALEEGQWCEVCPEAVWQQDNTGVISAD